MSAVELDLIAAMIDQQNLDPLTQGWVRDTHCLTEQGRALFHFLVNYQHITNGTAHVPSRQVIASRFQGIILPATAGNESLSALAHEVRTNKMRADIRQLSEDLATLSGMTDPTESFADLRKQLDLVMVDAVADEDLSFDVALDNIMEAYASGNILPNGIPWPWQTLTDGTRGMHRGEFYLIAGRPKSRKTFIALSVAAFVFQQFGTRVLFVSPEMPQQQIMLRFAATIAALHYSQFKATELTPEEEQQLVAMACTYGRRQLETPDPVMDSTGDVHIPMPREGTFIVTRAGKGGMPYIASKIKQHRPTLVVIDSVYRIFDSNSKKRDMDWKNVGNISRDSKDMAMSEDVIVLATHQLNREAEEKVGGLQNLALTDAFAQDCDLAMRAITAKRRHGDKTALVVLGGRETASEGVIINNIPCSDYSEIAPITSRKLVLRMLTEEEEEDAEDQLASGGKTAAKPGKAVNRLMQKLAQTDAPDSVDASA